MTQKIKKKYFIYVNDYKDSLNLEIKIKKFIANFTKTSDAHFRWQYNKDKPDLVFCIGGDGVILRAIHDLQSEVANAKLITVKSGALGFYSNFTSKDIIVAMPSILNNQMEFNYYPLLKITGCDHHKYYALNEIKVIDHIKTLRTKIFINHDYLQYFRGSGLIFATASGSTGYMRALHGAIIISDYPMWEMKELAPVNNSTFSTINTPLILDQTKRIILKGELQDKWLIVDTFAYQITCDSVTVELSTIKVALVFQKDHRFNLVKQLKNIFSLNGDKHNNYH